MAAEEELAALGLVTCRDEALCLVQGIGHEGPLLVVEVLHIGPIFHELLVSGGLFHRSGNDERGTGVVDEDGVNLIHDGVVMLPLDEV